MQQGGGGSRRSIDADEALSHGPDSVIDVLDLFCFSCAGGLSHRHAEEFLTSERIIAEPA